MKFCSVIQGQVERLNGKIKRVLSHLMHGLSQTVMGMMWPYFLPSVQHALNRTSHGSTGSSPIEIFRGYQPLPNDHQLGIGKI